MSLKEKLEKEERELKEAEENATATVPIALGAVQVVLRTVRDFLADLPAEIKDGKARLQQPLKAWNAVPFPNMTIGLRKRTVSILPIGPVIGYPFRIDLKSQGAAYSMLWDGMGSSINNWSIVPQAPRGDHLNLRKSKHVSKGSLDEAFQKLVGF